MKRNWNHLFQIVLIYILIAVSGYLSYNYSSSGSEIVDFLIADVVMTVVCFICSLIKKNSSVYDPFWSVIPFYFVLLWIYLHDDVLSIYHWLIFIVISLWSWRLTINWVRSWHDFNHEDWRYVKLAEDNGALYPLVNFFGIHLLPTFWVFGGMWPLFYIFDGTAPNMIILLCGLIISLVGTALEFFADNTLAKFRKRPDKKTGDLLDEGLWGRCRHPNYLGEMLFWIGLFVCGYAFGAPLFTGLGCLSIVLLFVFISIPMKEKRMAERRPGYEDYKKRVPLLVPGLG